GLLEKVDDDKVSKRILKEQVKTLSSYIQKWVQSVDEGKKIIISITTHILEEADRAREKVSVMDKWKEELTKRGSKIIEEAIKCYKKLNELSNDAIDQLKKCVDELYFWEIILPKMEALVQLDDQLVEDEQIVPLEESGIQHTYEGNIKLRVKNL
ncbi:hypothetical protein KI387_020999, partial [Taxus chinensis]